MFKYLTLEHLTHKKIENRKVYVSGILISNNNYSIISVINNKNCFLININKYHGLQRGSQLE